MKAHKVPATYYASWKIPGKNHSFYVFYKDKLYNEGQSKSCCGGLSNSTFLVSDYYNFTHDEIPPNSTIILLHCSFLLLHTICNIYLFPCWDRGLTFPEPLPLGVSA